MKNGQFFLNGTNAEPKNWVINLRSFPLYAKVKLGTFESGSKIENFQQKN